MKVELFILAAVVVLNINCGKKPFRIVQVPNPEFIPNTKFSSFEDLSSPKFDQLKAKFHLDTIFHGEEDEFKRVLLLRDWIKKKIRIDNVGPFPGDESAESILEEALKGHGFHCAHFSLVQEAIMNAFGYVTRFVRIDDCDPINGEGHHAVNEIWLNKYHKWFMSDAKYNYHFEKDGVPLSALEIRSEYLKNKAADITMVKGAGRTPITINPEPNNRRKELFARICTWISWSKDNDIYTRWPDNSSKLIVFNDEYFRSHVWMRDGKPHWAYNTIYFDSVTNKKIIEWTPNTISAQTSIKGDSAFITLHSETPNFRTYQMKMSEDRTWKDIPAFVKLRLTNDHNDIFFRTTNTAGVAGPEYHLSVSK